MPQKQHKTGFRGPSAEVGKATQFKPGNRANPGGRPKKRAITSALEKLLDESRADGIAPMRGDIEAASEDVRMDRMSRAGKKAALNSFGFKRYIRTH